MSLPWVNLAVEASHHSLPTMKVLIPTPLRQYTGKQATVEVAASIVGEMLNQLTSQFPDLRKQLFMEDGKLRRFVNVYVNDEDIRYLAQENTLVKDSDTISIVPSVAGGVGRVGQSSDSASEVAVRQSGR
jgi:MoaD family protein